MKIIHGNHAVHSRDAVVKEIERAKALGLQVTRINAKNCSLSDLELLLGEQSLFAQKKLLVLELLHSLPKSTRKQELISFVQKQQETDLMLWEQKELTPTELKKFPQAKVLFFPTSSTLFKWLDCLKDERAKKQALAYLQEAKAVDGAGFCFAMLIRQIRLLLIAKDGGTLTGPTFVQTKLRTQASRFSLSELLELHQKLLALDIQNKQSQNALSIEEQLDLFTLSL